ncbi:MAG TPA: NADH-quinone oxidoreductase subunit L [Acidimicrobiales bacterium]|nr:NADH-quinone oxidoreductase subunit L [Acidimicrobiales bacterium]
MLQLLATEAGAAAAETFEPGWLTRNVWLIPLLPVVSFVLTLFFGKRFRSGGTFFGVGLMGLALLLSTALGVEWLNRGHVELEEHAPPAIAATYRGTAAGDEEHPVDHVIEEAERTGKPTASSGGHGAEEPGEHSEENPAEHGAEKPAEGHALPTGRLSLPRTESGGAPPAAEGGHGEEAAEHGHAIEVRPYSESEASWFHIGAKQFGFGFHVDGFAVAMLFTVCFISFLVHLFSTEYLRDDRRKTHYFAALGLFTAGMLLMVSSSTGLQLLLGWEIMGLCSFLLIGHWWEESKNSDAALKAFFTTRTGDVGLLVGLSILYFGAGETFNIAKINQQAITGGIPNTWLVCAAAALFVACIGKSAQFPLHTWLPDAMAGPTPVSALIHAATMVVAGVYLVARLYGVFWEGFSIADGGLNFGAVIGAVTVVIAALLAFAQNDIKKVLAYSTISQLGYMVMALCVGAWTAGIFHLFTHAMFKGLLFLGSGSISHAVHSFDMKKDMGGLRTVMPTTYKTFLIGSLALAGVFPLAGFWSKDEILLGASENGYKFFLLIGLAGAFMTACYMTRCVYLTFFGEYRGHGHPHESPPAITIPLIVLAVLSAAAGLLNAPGIELFSKWTENEAVLLAGVAHHEFSISTAMIGMAFGLAGITAGYLYYWRNLGPHRLTERNAAAMAGYRLLENKYYLDRLYTDGIVGSIKGPIARAAYIVNQRVIDAVVNAAGIGARKAGDFTYDVLDQKGVDGIVNGVGLTAEEGGSILRVLQTGRVQQYAAFLFGGVVLLGGALVLFT